MKLDNKFTDISPVRTDARKRLFLKPTRLMMTQGDITNTEVILKENCGQVTLSRKSELCLLTNAPDKPHAAFLVDFGREIHGCVRLYSHSKGGRVRVRLGESAMEALTPLGVKNTKNDHAIRDFEMDCPFYGYHDSGESGFRFAYVEFLADEGVLQLCGIEAILIYRDVEYIGSFECNDEIINKIYDTAAYTAHLNMQDYMWDGIKRDRLVWIGDMHPEVMTICNVFGDNEVVPKSLDHVRDGYPVGYWMNNISSYSVWWLMCHYDYYMHVGDSAYLASQKEYIHGLMEIMKDLMDENGVEKMPEGRFLDWPTKGNTEAEHAGLQALLYIALNMGSRLLTKLGDTQLAEECRAKAQLLTKHIPDPNGSKQAAGLLAFSGIGDAKKLDDEVISVGGAHGYSTFYSYYILAAKVLAGNTAEGLEHMKEYYGKMLELGATTFWEDFNLDWAENAAGIDEIVPEGKDDIHGDFGAYCYANFRHSLCHGWSSGPVPFLMRHVLGITVLEPGCKKLLVRPELCGLEYVKGTFPTPYGVVTVYADKDGVKITAPKEVDIVR